MTAPPPLRPLIRGSFDCSLSTRKASFGPAVPTNHTAQQGRVPSARTYQRGVILDFSRPGKPTDNAFSEAFNSKLRSECLNAHWFLSLQDACEKLEAWRRHYNEERPHSAIGNIPPIMLANSAGETSSPDLSKAENSRVRTQSAY